jgi:hypothetical protein
LETSTSALRSSKNLSEAAVPRQEAAMVTAFAVTFAPCDISNRTFSASGAAIMSRVVPRSVLLLGSRPASSNPASCFADPNSAVRIHAGVSAASLDSTGPLFLIGSDESIAITAHELAA